FPRYSPPHFPLLFSYCFVPFSSSPPPPRSTLFPYTTLFRSCRPTLRSGRRRPSPSSSAAGSGPAPPILATSMRTTCRLSADARRSEEHTSELQSRVDLVCRLLLEKKKNNTQNNTHTNNNRKR